MARRTVAADKPDDRTDGTADPRSGLFGRTSSRKTSRKAARSRKRA